MTGLTSSVCQSPATKTSFEIDNMFFDSDRIAEYLTSLRPSAPLFALIKFRLGAQRAGNSKSVSAIANAQRGGCSCSCRRALLLLHFSVSDATLLQLGVGAGSALPTACQPGT